MIFSPGHAPQALTNQDEEGWYEADFPSRNPARGSSGTKEIGGMRDEHDARGFPDNDADNQLGTGDLLKVDCGTKVAQRSIFPSAWKVYALRGCFLPSFNLRPDGGNIIVRALRLC
jgi:hypothetical protein